MTAMRIGARSLDEKVLIVAEIGNNHEGKVAVAEEMVRKAGEAGADAVKFQTFQTKLFTSNADPARFKRLSSFELTYPEFAGLEKLARSLGVMFISTPLDLESARFLEPLVDAFKIASGDNDFFPLIAQVCRTKKPIIISTGMSDLAAVKRTHRFTVEQLQLADRSADDLAFLHCVASYPAPPAEANLAAIALLKAELGCTIGYSDHTSGPDASVLAVALGARIIEKHFTLDKHFSDFRDHQLSADPAEMRQIVTRIREAETLIGRPVKEIQTCEVATAKVARRSIVAASDLPIGHALSDRDLLWLRPAGGLSPGNEHLLLGKRLKREVRFGEPLAPTDVE